MLNSTLFDFVTAEAPLGFQRVAIANRMAPSAPEWVSVFSRYNSGTYNNQWIVLDYNRFRSGSALVPDTLWISEQMPGKIVRYAGDSRGFACLVAQASLVTCMCICVCSLWDW